MTDNRPTNDAQARLGGSSRGLAERDIARLWEEFRSGGVAECPRDGAPVALAVDGTVKAYRLVCTRCGVASPWFHYANGTLHLQITDDLGDTTLSDD